MRFKYAKCGKRGKLILKPGSRASCQAGNQQEAYERTVQHPVRTPAPAPAGERRRVAGQRCPRCCEARSRLRCEEVLCCGCRWMWMPSELACACITQVQHFIRYLSSRLYLRTTRVSQTAPTQCALSNLTSIHSADDQCRAPPSWTKLSSTNTRFLICSTCNTHAHQTFATECHTHHSFIRSAFTHFPSFQQNQSYSNGSDFLGVYDTQEPI